MTANGVLIKKLIGCYINHRIGQYIWQTDRIMSADVFWY